MARGRHRDRRMRVLIADDHAVLRAGLKLLIDAQPDMEVIGEASDAPSTIELSRRLAPDVVLVDLSMPGGGLTAIEALRETDPDLALLVLTMHDDPAYLRAALAAGASGYIVKRAADSELLSSIRSVSRGATVAYLTTPRSEVVGLLAPESAGRLPGRRALSRREDQVLRLVAQGYTSREIAKRVSLSVKSVETYRARLSRKLGLKSRAELVRYALETGLLGSDALPRQEERR